MEVSKENLRREYRAARQGFSREAGKSVRSKIENHILRLIRDLTDERSEVGLFKPSPEETPFKLKGDYFYPVVDGQNLKFFCPRGRKLVVNKFGIEEPDPASSLEMKGWKPVIFTPAVAVDVQGDRLGMGQGFYDRFFARYPQAVRIGVVFQIQVSKAPLPAESWDMPLDWIVTENMILRTSQRSA